MNCPSTEQLAALAGDEGARELFKAIQDAAAGRQYVSPSISAEALRSYQQRLETGASSCCRHPGLPAVPAHADLIANTADHC